MILGSPYLSAAITVAILGVYSFIKERATKTVLGAARYGAAFVISLATSWAFCGRLEIAPVSSFE